MDAVPLGFHFRPKDEELISHYLRPKVLGEPLSWSGVHHCDLYSDSPWQILKDGKLFWETSPTTGEEKSGTNPTKIKRTTYVFTTLEKKKEGKKNVKRIAGIGTWDAQTSGKKICNGRNQIIGFRKMLGFELQKGLPSENTLNFGRWIMQEYSLGGVNSDLQRPNTPQIVLCKIDVTEFFNNEPIIPPNLAPKEDCSRKRKLRVDEEEEIGKNKKTRDEVVIPKSSADQDSNSANMLSVASPPEVLPSFDISDSGDWAMNSSVYDDFAVENESENLEEFFESVGSEIRAFCESLSPLESDQCFGQNSTPDAALPEPLAATEAASRPWVDDFVMENNSGDNPREVLENTEIRSFCESYQCFLQMEPLAATAGSTWPLFDFDAQPLSFMMNPIELPVLDF